MDVIELMKKEMLRRNYSLRTIQTYVFCLKRFLRYYKGEPRKIKKNDVKKYLDMLVDREKGGSTINVHLNALRFLMIDLLGKSFFVKVKYSKVPKRLPVILTKEEVSKMIDSIKNRKHKLMIKLMYGAGLRVSELVNLRVKDLDIKNNLGWVRKGKGNKDRLFIVAGILRKELSDYVRELGLGDDSWLFNGRYGHISVRSIQMIVKKAAKKADISKNVHCHTLRHSFSTHLIEDGYDVVTIQSLLGHNSTETTMIYVHMASPKIISVKSPLDNLNLDEGKIVDSQLKNGAEKSLSEFLNPAIRNAIP